MVSIRATRAGRDAGRRCARGSSCRFYPRDPCGPRRSTGCGLSPASRFLSARPVRAATPISISAPTQVAKFLSARPVRAATPRAMSCAKSRCSFYPRDPCGPRRGLFYELHDVMAVSIRATRAGRDKSPRKMNFPRSSFYPRDPCGPRPQRDRRAGLQPPVSIRATRAGRDEDVELYVRESWVSIRATRAGRDLVFLRPVPAPVGVSIRATRAGRD